MEKNEMSVAEFLQQIDARQRNIEALLISQKNVLTLDEAATYMGISKSHLYKMCMLGSIPFSKPRGKMNYFDRAELEKFLLQNRITPDYEIEAQAQTYVTLNDRRARK